MSKDKEVRQMCVSSSLNIMNKSVQKVPIIPANQKCVLHSEILSQILK